MQPGTCWRSQGLLCLPWAPPRGHQMQAFRVHQLNGQETHNSMASFAVLRSVPVFKSICDPSLEMDFLKIDYLRVATYSISTFKAHGFLGTFQCGTQIPVAITELIRERVLGSHWGCGRELELFLICLLGGVGNLGTFFHQH